jgi:predicted transposase/invertase (TIGR01784 family)
MITERDWENIKSTARREGREEGREDGRAEERLAVAKNLKSLGISFADIAKATGLTIGEIEEL